MVVKTVVRRCDVVSCWLEDMASFALDKIRKGLLVSSYDSDQETESTCLSFLCGLNQ